MIVKNDYRYQLDLEIIEWDAPGFRLLYFPLWISWHISESVTKKLLKRLIIYEDARKDGKTDYCLLL